MKKNILIVIGTRPNFIKVTQFKKLALKFPFLNLKIVHTGQHYDDKMADVFFKQFDLTPDYFLKHCSRHSQLTNSRHYAEVRISH
jgi:UDP-N-acetylglucosamine 2-epimerase (non-hydrolysing)